MTQPWIQTYSGIQFSIASPSARQILIEDIAWSLAHTNRFNGHTARPYSVAEHCVRMSYAVEPGDAMWALLHDGAEAYIGDIVGPFKHLAPGLNDAEEVILDIIASKWCPDLTDETRARVHACDKWIVHEERAKLLPQRVGDWTEPPDFTPRKTHLGGRMGWSGRIANQRFLARFHKLRHNT